MFEMILLFTPACTLLPFYEPPGYRLCSLWFGIREITVRQTGLFLKLC